MNDRAHQADESTPADIALMLRVKEGDEEALALLIRRYQAPLFGFFRSMGLGEEAEDAAQETFLRLYRYRHRYEPRASLRTFIYMMARQVCVDAFRRRQRRDRLREGLERETRAAEDASPVAGDEAALVAELLHELPEAMRMTVVMNIYQGLSYEEIAGALGIPVGTVKSRMFHAMSRLREALRERRKQS